MKFVYGTEIKSRYSGRRDCFSELQEFMTTRRYDDNVCAIYGLRRTGKTVMMEQMISDFSQEDAEKTVFILCESGDEFDDLDDRLEALHKEGIQNVFIDEITELEDFVRKSNTLSDYFSKIKGMKFVLSGTDSLGFSFAKKDKLHDRITMIHTSYVSFAEYKRLLGISDVVEYLKYGGTLTLETYRNLATTKEHQNTAIVQNVIRSLKNTENGRGYYSTLTQLYSDEDLISAINKVIDKLSQEFVYKQILKRYKSGVLTRTEEIFDKPSRGINRIKYKGEKYHKEKILEALKEIFFIDEKQIPLKQPHFEELKQYFKDLDLVAELEIADTNMEFITQWGMNYCHVTETLKQLRRYDVWKEDASEQDKDKFIEKAESFATGRLLENIVLYETYLALKHLPEFLVSKYAIGSQEVDMVIYNRETTETYIFEVKLSQIVDEHQKRNLINEEFLGLLSSKYGEIKGKFVLYRGETKTVDSDGVVYLNVEEFLLQMAENKSVNLFNSFMVAK